MKEKCNVGNNVPTSILSPLPLFIDELKRQGYDLDRIAKRVAEIYGMEKGEVFSKGGQQRRVKAKSLLCFWAVREIGMSLRELAGRLEMSAPGVGYAVERGEAIAHRNGHKLIE